MATSQGRGAPTSPDVPPNRLPLRHSRGQHRAPVTAATADEEMKWISRYRRVWDARFEALDSVIEQLKSRDKPDVRKKRK